MHLCLTTLIIIAASGYVLLRFGQCLKNCKRCRHLCLGIFIASSILFIVTLLLRTHDVKAWYLVFQNITYGWVVFVFYLFLLVLILDIIRAFLFVFHRHSSPKKALSSSFQKKYYLFSIIFSFTLLLFGTLHFRHPKIREITFTLNKPCPNWTFVAVSDLHLGTMSPKLLLEHVKSINALHPDVILLLGDQFVIKWQDISDLGYASTLQQLKAEKGIYAINGNHEYFHHLAHNPSPECERLFREMGIMVLEDSVIIIDNQLALIGRDDTTNIKRKPLPKLITDISDSIPIIVLDHNPSNLQAAQKAGVDIQLSGHTHNGQIFPLNLWGRLKNLWNGKLTYGFRKEGNTQYYVTSGLGGSGVPIRIGTSGEIVEIHLVQY